MKLSRRKREARKAQFCTLKHRVVRDHRFPTHPGWVWLIVRDDRAWLFGPDGMPRRYTDEDFARRIAQELDAGRGPIQEGDFFARSVEEANLIAALRQSP